jgi:hypothetical protein
VWEAIIGLIVAAVLVEVAAIVVFGRRDGATQERSWRPADSSDEHDSATLRSLHVLHPYFGFTMRPGRTPEGSFHPVQIGALCTGPGEGLPSERPSWLDLEANALGMWSEHPFPYEPAPGEIVIGIFGSSVASFFGMQGTRALEERLAQIPELAGNRIVVLNFGIQGGKQPQQLAVLNYVLSCGQHLDVAINIDGINELLWATYNHRVQGVDFTFPTAHLLAPLKHLIHGGDASIEGVLALADSLRNRKRADQLRRLRSRVPSAAVRTLLRSAERRLRTAANARFGDASRVVVSPDVDPLPFPAARTPEKDPDFAEYWRDCSLQLHRICLAHRIIYLHVLQPTPFTSGRQPTEAERYFLGADNPNHRILIEGYPRLAELGEELRAAGIPFASADAAFARIPQTIFSDTWGHLNQLGNEVLAEFLGIQIERIVHEPEMAAQA